MKNIWIRVGALLILCGLLVVLPESDTKFFYADSSDRQLEFKTDTDGNVFKAYLIANGVRSELIKQKTKS